MNVTLWILQVLLAAVFAMHGLMLLFPPPELVEVMNSQLGVTFRIGLGFAEVLGAIGILLPAITRVMPQLTAISAACFGFVMVSATVWHVVRAEYGSAGLTFILLIVSAFVAYGRWKITPITGSRFSNLPAGSGGRPARS